MATITFAARVEQDLRLLSAADDLIAWSRGKGSGATELTTKITRACQMGAAKVESVCGAAGSYDDSDVTVGDQGLLDLAVRLTQFNLQVAYSGRFTAEDVAVRKSLLEEITAYAETLVAEAATPVVYDVDGELDEDDEDS